MFRAWARSSGISRYYKPQIYSQPFAPKYVRTTLGEDDISAQNFQLTNATKVEQEQRNSVQDATSYTRMCTSERESECEHIYTYGEERGEF